MGLILDAFGILVNNWIFISFLIFVILFSLGFYVFSKLVKRKM